MATISGSLSRKPATQATKQSENRLAGSAFITSLSVSCDGTPRAKGKRARRKPSLRVAQRSISAKSSAPAITPHSTISRISGNG